MRFKACGRLPLQAPSLIAIAGMIMVAVCMASAAHGQVAARRVVSINLCTDQLLLALGDDTQIAGLGRFAGRADMSFMMPRAAAFPTSRGSAEDVLDRRPDLVLAGAFSGSATRGVLAAKGVRTEVFAPPRTVSEALAEIERAATLLGQVPRGHALAGEIERALAEAAVQAGQVRATIARPLTALALQPRGYVSGSDTLLVDIMRQAGLVDAAARVGVRAIGKVGLETIIKARPDVLVVEGGEAAADQATALLHHPALRAKTASWYVLALPTAETACAGPALPALIRRLANGALRASQLLAK